MTLIEFRYLFFDVTVVSDCVDGIEKAATKNKYETFCFVFDSSLF